MGREDVSPACVPTFLERGSPREAPRRVSAAEFFFPGIAVEEVEEEEVMEGVSQFLAELREDFFLPEIFGEGFVEEVVEEVVEEEVVEGVVEGLSQFLAKLKAAAGPSPPGVHTPGPPPAAAFPSLQCLPPFVPASGGLGSPRALNSPPPPFLTPDHPSFDSLQVELGASPALRPRQEQLVKSGPLAIGPRQPCSLVGMAARAMEGVPQQPGRPALGEQAIARVIDIGLEDGASTGERREEEDEEEEIEAAGVQWRLERGMEEALQMLVGSLGPSPPASPITLPAGPTAPTPDAARGGRAGQDQVLLGPWVQAEVPGPAVNQPPPTADGWADVDSLGAWDCGICPFRTLEQVPTAFREKFSRAMANILERLGQATTELEETRALKWFLLCPQLFLREPKRGGTKGQGHAAINVRFEAVSAGSWGELLALLVQDRQEQQRHPRRRLVETGGEVGARKKQDLQRKTVLSLLARGQISRAVRLITSHGVASMEDPWVREALEVKLH